MSNLRISIVLGRYAICRVERTAQLPPWAPHGEFLSVTVTREELSLVCSEQMAPAGTIQERGFRALKLEGPFPLSSVGILASVLDPLAKAGVSIFAVSTFDTDYVLVKDESLAVAVRALRSAGHTVEGDYAEAQKQNAPKPRKPKYTETQGRYLAFIAYYKKLHGCAPSEREMQDYFRVSPPTVHQMILKLDALGLIARTPGEARSIRLLVPDIELPPLK